MFVPGLLLCKRSEYRRVLWVSLFQVSTDLLSCNNSRLHTVCASVYVQEICPSRINILHAGCLDR